MIIPAPLFLEGGSASRALPSDFTVGQPVQSGPVPQWEQSFSLRSMMGISRWPSGGVQEGGGVGEPAGAGDRWGPSLGFYSSVLPCLFPVFIHSVRLSLSLGVCSLPACRAVCLPPTCSRRGERRPRLLVSDLSHPCPTRFSHC